MGILVPHKHTAIMVAMSRVLQGMLGLGMLASTAFGSSTDTQDWRYPCLGGKNEIIVNDIHSGRMNKITFNENNGTFGFFVITPYGNNETWSVHSWFDNNCEADIKINDAVIGFKDIKLRLTAYLMSAVDEYHKVGIEISDPSGTIASANRPLNMWVELDEHHEVNVTGDVGKIKECLLTPEPCGLVLNDMHDEDRKFLKVKDNKLQITPDSSPRGVWKVDAKFNKRCAARVDFNVRGKPNPPPVPLRAKVWHLQEIHYAALTTTEMIRPAQDKQILIFTDPSGKLAHKHTALNAWVPDNKHK